MTDSLLSREDVQEALSKAFLSAVAAKAGYVVSEPSLDRDGIDMVVEAGADFRPKIAFQLKATTLLDKPEVSGNFRFPCPVKNYEKLRLPTQTPRLLLVYKMPKDEEKWVEFLEDEAFLRHCAYWVSLKGKPQADQKTTITIDVPAVNRLTVEELRWLMGQSRSGAL